MIEGTETPILDSIKFILDDYERKHQYPPKALGIVRADFQELCEELGITVLPVGNPYSRFGRSILLGGVHIYISVDLPPGFYEPVL